MNLTDWIGFIGVMLLLVAFFLNLMDRLDNDSRLYIWLNILGAGIACYASIRLHYLPFIILEGMWTLVSLLSLLKHHKQ
jgi:hypothetical protein